MSDSDGAAEARPNPFTAAKANLREVVKWLATALAGLAAAILAGTTVAGIAGLDGCLLAIALAAGVFGILCVLWELGILLDLLMAETMYFGELLSDPKFGDVRDKIDRHANDTLSPLFDTLEQFNVFRVQKKAALIKERGNPQSQEYKNALAAYSQGEDEAARILEFAHFEAMRQNLRGKLLPLFLVAVLALAGLGTFAVLTGGARKNQTDRPAVVTIVCTQGKGILSCLPQPAPH